MTAIRHKHLKRLDVVFDTQPMYFITSCLQDRRHLLACDGAMRILVEEWTSALSKHSWGVGRFVIMPDHVHFFCRPAVSAVSLSIFMMRWKEWTSKKLSRTLAAAQPIWQPKFFDHLLRSDESYSEKWLYVRDNPVRAGLVASQEDWKYQGYVHYP